MALFDFYIMVDWSGGARRRGSRSDTIWLVHGRRTADTPLTNSPHSRTEAIELIESILERAIRSKQRVLLCFDFAYGYPVDFAPALQAATGKSDRDLPWLTMWQYCLGWFFSTLLFFDPLAAEAAGRRGRGLSENDFAQLGLGLVRCQRYRCRAV